MMPAALQLAAAAVAAAPPTAKSSAAATTAMQQHANAMLQGDAMAAMRALKRVPASEYRAAHASERACVLERFDRAAQHDLPAALHDDFTGQLITAYRRYWWHALRQPARRGELEAALLARMRTLLGITLESGPDFDALAPTLAARLHAAGYHALPPGRSAPLQELMIWRRQESREFSVVLPESVQAVRLVVLDDFASRGWSHCARCGQGSAAGWATREGLYAVRPACDDLDGETFRISLHGHEAQHFADYQRFPRLAGWELEYHAKLTELVLAASTQATLLAKFGAAQGDDVDSPQRNTTTP